MPERTLVGPIVHADTDGFTFLSGANVDLAPRRLEAIRARLVGPARRPAAGDVEFLSFAVTRTGLVGCRGVLRTACDGAAEVDDLEAFGSDRSLPAFGAALGRYLAGHGAVRLAEGLDGATGRIRPLAEGLADAWAARAGAPGIPAP